MYISSYTAPTGIIPRIVKKKLGGESLLSLWHLNKDRKLWGCVEMVDEVYNLWFIARVSYSRLARVWTLSVQVSVLGSLPYLVLNRLSTCLRSWRIISPMSSARFPFRKKSKWRKMFTSVLFRAVENDLISEEECDTCKSYNRFQCIKTAVWINNGLKW